MLHSHPILALLRGPGDVCVEQPRNAIEAIDDRKRRSVFRIVARKFPVFGESIEHWHVVHPGACQLGFPSSMETVHLSHTNVTTRLGQAQSDQALGPDRFRTLMALPQFLAE